MDVGLERFQPLLVGHSEMLLFVDNNQSQVLELQSFCRASAWVPMTISTWPLARPSLVALLSVDGHQPRQPADLDREAAQAFDELIVVLAGEQGRRADQRDLQPRHGGDEGGAKRDLGLAEADVAAHQPVHRLAR